MTEVKRGQIWRNIYGAHVVVDGIGPYHRPSDGTYEALWVTTCDAHGLVIGDQIPMEPGPNGFPGKLWTLVGEA